MQSHTGTVKSDKELTQCGHVLDLIEDVPQLTAFIIIFFPHLLHTLDLVLHGILILQKYHGIQLFQMLQYKLSLVSRLYE